MRLWFGLVAALLLVSRAAAIDAVPLSISDLTKRAELIVRGKVESKSIQRDSQGRVFTEVKLLVSEVWKGDPKAPLLTVVHSGGILGEEKVVVVGQVEYEVGEEVVGFYVWNERGQAMTVAMGLGKIGVKGMDVAGLRRRVKESQR